jgi:glycosyltransferase involved in cell wall biosynthesis
MHVLIVSSWFPSKKYPLDGCFVIEQAKLLRDSGHQVTIFVPQLSGSSLQTWTGSALRKKRFLFEGMPVYFCPVNVWIPYQKKHYVKKLLAKSSSMMHQIIQQEGAPDVIHSHAALMGGFVSSSLQSTFSIPHVHTEHMSSLIFNSEQLDALDLKQLRHLGEKADRFLFVSNFALEKTSENLSLQIKKPGIIHNLVDSPFFEVKPPPSKFSALCIGDFKEIKNQKDLVAAWKKVAEFLPDAELVLAGNGDKTLLEEQARGLGILKNITFLPGLNRKEVLQRMSQAYVVISSSILETFGLTIAEALAVGRPVVATNSGGVRDIIQPGDGYIVPQNDIDSFSDAIINISKGMHDSPAMISARCRGKFGADAFSKRLFEIYIELKK